MNLKLKPKSLTVFVLCACAAGFALRKLLYAYGIDGRNLLTENHPASIALWVLTAAVGAVLFCFVLQRASGDCCRVSSAGAAGCFAAAAAVGYVTIQESGNFFTTMDMLLWVLGLLSAIAFLGVGICRLRRKTPYFLLHAVICIYLALRMVAQYRLYSADPQLMDYCFYLSAYVALMLTAYHHAACDAAMGRPELLYVLSLAGVYLCCVSLGHTEDPFLLSGFALWAFTNLPCRKQAAAKPVEE